MVGYHGDAKSFPLHAAPTAEPVTTRAYNADYPFSWIWLRQFL
jgi:hypothetical protein